MGLVPCAVNRAGWTGRAWSGGRWRWAGWCRGRLGSGCRVGRGLCGGGSAQVGRATWTSPSVMVMVQSPWCRSTWWRRHSRHRLCTAVAPPSIQDCRWWASHCTGGAPQTTQPLSRAFRARRIAPVTSRSARPTSSGSDFDPSTSGMTFASQASRRMVAADRPSPYTRSPIASAAADFRSCRSMVTVMFAFAPNPGIRPDPPAPAARPVRRTGPGRPIRVRRTGPGRTGTSRTRHPPDWHQPHPSYRRQPHPSSPAAPAVPAPAAPAPAALVGLAPAAPVVRAPAVVAPAVLRRWRL